uniref:Uncharacterized protein n=1 Tax=Chromera velia CCMP2878 TaxID=1169474 RepID=A0A0G4F3A3_9ALVE|eukprot:Cvel_15009.t1-p1 / transcript=Cvel_15009.t1 / gene=Cvel_15009 / organism=Chromera_velia_CCMP2878 / gene_product=hypothetical protein / transcript_product=hypothetical protein / location=Cvel_scaffold1092:33065-34435(-) / protein_length=457 / sequence_SO=supercontig / SO=protein_coding / is_pseudo=false
MEEADNRSDRIQEVEGQNTASCLFPDFVLEGKEFEGLRNAAARIVELKTQVNKLLPTAPRVPNGLLAELSNHDFQELLCKAAAFLDLLCPLATSLDTARSRLKVELREAQQRLQMHSCPQTSGSHTKTSSPEWMGSFIVLQLLMVKNFFYSVMWFFGLQTQDFDQTKEVFDDYRRVRKSKCSCCERKQESSQLFSANLRALNSCGAKILGYLLSRWPRLNEKLWQSKPFFWSLKKNILQTIRDPNETSGLESALKFLHFLTEQKSHHREAVEALSACAAPGASKAEKEGMDLSLLFRGCFRLAVGIAEKEKRVRVRPPNPKEHSHRIITAWDNAVGILRSISTLQDQRKAEKEAFASPHATTDAMTLYAHALRAYSEKAETCVTEMSQMSFRAKAIEVCFQNPKIAKQVEKEKTKEILQTLQSLVELQKSLKPNSHAGTYIALLMLRLQESPNFSAE